MIKYKNNNTTSYFNSTTEADNAITKEKITSQGYGKKRICVKYHNSTTSYGLTTDITASQYSPKLNMYDSDFYFASATKYMSTSISDAIIPYIQTTEINSSDITYYSSTTEIQSTFYFTVRYTSDIESKSKEMSNYSFLFSYGSIFPGVKSVSLFMSKEIRCSSNKDIINRSTSSDTNNTSKYQSITSILLNSDICPVVGFDKYTNYENYQALIYSSYMSENDIILRSTLKYTDEEHPSYPRYARYEDILSSVSSQLISYSSTYNSTSRCYIYFTIDLTYSSTSDLINASKFNTVTSRMTLNKNSELALYDIIKVTTYANYVYTLTSISTRYGQTGSTSIYGTVSSISTKNTYYKFNYNIEVSSISLYSCSTVNRSSIKYSSYPNSGYITKTELYSTTTSESISVKTYVSSLLPFIIKPENESVNTMLYNEFLFDYVSNTTINGSTFKIGTSYSTTTSQSYIDGAYKTVTADNTTITMPYYISFIKSINADIRYLNTIDYGNFYANTIAVYKKYSYDSTYTGYNSHYNYLDFEFTGSESLSEDLEVDIYESSISGNYYYKSSGTSSNSSYSFTTSTYQNTEMKYLKNYVHIKFTRSYNNSGTSTYSFSYYFNSGTCCQGNYVVYPVSYINEYNINV